MDENKLRNCHPQNMWFFDTLQCHKWISRSDQKITIYYKPIDNFIFMVCGLLLKDTCHPQVEYFGSHPHPYNFIVIVIKGGINC